MMGPQTMSQVRGLIEVYWFKFASGLRVTLLLSLGTIALGCLLGVVLYLVRVLPFKPLRMLANGYIEIIRGTPMLLQLYFFVFVVPGILGVRMPYIQSIMIAMALSASAYISELIRAGIQAVDRGQAEAARSLGLSAAATMRLIVLPQAVKNTLPALGNEFISIIKGTSLASVFLIGDLMTVQKSITGALYQTLAPMIVVGFLYFFINFTLSKLIALYEKKVSLA